MDTEGLAFSRSVRPSCQNYVCSSLAIATSKTTFPDKMEKVTTPSKLPFLCIYYKANRTGELVQ